MRRLACECQLDTVIRVAMTPIFFLSAVIVYFTFLIVPRKSATTNKTMSELNKFRKHYFVHVSPLNVIASTSVENET